MNAREIAEVCHEANRALQHIFWDPNPAPSWNETSIEIQQSVINGVSRVLENPLIGPADIHDEWVIYKKDQGYVYGPAKNEELRTHPNMVPWDQLPPEQRIKDRLFIAICRALEKNGHA